MRFGKWLCCLLLATAAVGAAKDSKESARKTFRLEWRDLDRMTRGHNIDITLPSGIRLKGRVTSVEADALILDVRKTSNKRAYPKGGAQIPRPEVSRFSLAHKEGHTWSAVGAAVGGSIGAVVATGLVQLLGRDGQREAAAALAVGIPAAIGYGIGWSADHEWVDVIVESNSPSPPRL